MVRVPTGIRAESCFVAGILGVWAWAGTIIAAANTAEGGVPKNADFEAAHRVKTAPTCRQGGWVVKDGLQAPAGWMSSPAFPLPAPTRLEGPE